MQATIPQQGAVATGAIFEVHNQVKLPIAANAPREIVAVGSIVQLSAPTASWALCGSPTCSSVFTANPVSRPDLSAFRVTSCVSNSLPPALPRIATPSTAAGWSASAPPRIDMALQHLSQWPRLLARQLEASGVTRTTEVDIKRLVRSAMLSEGRILSMAVALEPNIMQAANGQAHAVYCIFGQHAGDSDPHSNSIEFDYLHPPSYVPLYRDWEWYTAPKISGRATWSEAYVDEGGGNVPMITYSVPLAHEGVFAGVVTMDIQLGQDDSVQAATLGATSALTVDRKGRAVFGSTQDAFANSEAADALSHIEALTRAPRAAASSLSRQLALEVTGPQLSEQATQHLHNVLDSSNVAFGSAVALAPSCMASLAQRSFYACRAQAVASEAPLASRQHSFPRDPSLRHLAVSQSHEESTDDSTVPSAEGTGGAPSQVQVSALPYDFTGDEWFDVPRGSQRDHWSEPYFDDGGGDVWMVTYSVPFFDSRQGFAGVVTLDVEYSDTVRKWFAATKPKVYSRHICYSTNAATPLKYFQVCGKTLSPQGMQQGPLPDDEDLLEDANAREHTTPEFASWSALARSTGKQVRVGDCIQLVHAASGLFLGAQLASSGEAGSTSFGLALEKTSSDPYCEGSLGTWFRIGSKAQAKGELLGLGDSLTLTSVRWHELVQLPHLPKVHTAELLATALQEKGIKREVALWCMQRLQSTPPSAARRSRTMSYLLMGSAAQPTAKGASYSKSVEEYLLDTLMAQANLLSQAPEAATSSELCMFSPQWSPRPHKETALQGAISSGAIIILRAGGMVLTASAPCHLGSTVLGQEQLSFAPAREQQQHDEPNIAAMWQAFPDPNNTGCFHLFHVASQRFLCIARGPAVVEAQLVTGGSAALSLPMPTAFSANDMRTIIDMESGLPYDSASAMPLMLSRSRDLAMPCRYYSSGDGETFEIGSHEHQGEMRLGVPDFEVVVDSLRLCTSSAIKASDGSISSKVLSAAKLACTSGRVALISQTAVNSSFQCHPLPPAAASTISRMVATSHTLRMAATFQAAADSAPELSADCAFDAWPCIQALIECCFILRCQYLGSDVLQHAQSRVADDELLTSSPTSASGGWEHADSFLAQVAPGLLPSAARNEPLRDPSVSAQNRFAGLHLPATVIHLAGQLLRMSVADSSAQWQCGWRRKAFLLCHAVLHMSVLQNKRPAETCFADLKSLLAQKAAVQRLSAQDTVAPRLILSTLAEALQASPTLLQLCPTDVIRELCASAFHEPDCSLQESLLSLLVQLVARPLDGFHSGMQGLLRNLHRQPVQDATDWRISARNQSLLVQLLLEDAGLRFIHARLGEGMGQLARSLPDSASLTTASDSPSKIDDAAVHSALAAFLRLLAYLCVGDSGKKLRALLSKGQLCSFPSLLTVAASEAMNQSREGIRSSCLTLLRVLHLEPYLVKDRPGTGPSATGPHSSTVTHTSTVDCIDDGTDAYATARQGSGVHRPMEACSSSSASRLHPLLLLSEPQSQLDAHSDGLQFPDIPPLSVARSRKMVAWACAYLQNSVALPEKNRVTLLVLALVVSMLRRGAVSRQDLPRIFNRCTGVLASSQEYDPTLLVQLPQVQLLAMRVLHLVVDCEVVWCCEDALTSRGKQVPGLRWVLEAAQHAKCFSLLAKGALHSTLALSHASTALLCRLSSLPDELLGSMRRAYTVTTAQEERLLARVCQLTSALREVTVWERTAESSQDLTVTDLALRTTSVDSLLQHLHACLAEQPEHLLMPSFIHCGLLDCLLDLVRSPLRVFIEAQRSAHFLIPLHKRSRKARGAAAASPLQSTKAAAVLRGAAQRKLPRNFLVKMRSLASRSGGRGFVGSQLLHGVYGLLCDAVGSGSATLELLRQSIGSYAQHIHITSNAARLIAKLLQNCPEQDIVASELSQVAQTIVGLLSTTTAPSDTAPLLQCILAVMHVSGHQEVKDSVVRSVMAAVRKDETGSATDSQQNYGAHTFWQLCHLHNSSLLRSVCERVLWRVGEFDALGVPADSTPADPAHGEATVIGLWLRIIIQGAPYRLRYVQGMAVRSREESAELLQSVLSAAALINGFLCCASVELKGLFLKALEQVYGPQSVLRAASGCCHLLPRGSVQLGSKPLMAVIMEEGLRMNERFLTGGVFARHPQRTTDSVADPAALMRFVFDTFSPFLVVYFHGCFDSSNPDPIVVQVGSRLFASMLDTAVNCLSLMGAVACKSTVVKDGKEEQAPLLLQTARTAQRDALASQLTASRLDKLVNALEHMRDPAGSLRGTGVTPSTADTRSAAMCSRVAAASDVDVSYIIQALQEKRQGLRAAGSTASKRPKQPAAASGAGKVSANPLAVPTHSLGSSLIRRLQSSRTWHRFRAESWAAFSTACIEEEKTFFPALLKLLTLDAHATRLMAQLPAFRHQLAPFARPWIVASPGTAACILKLLTSFVASDADHRQELLQHGCAVMVAQVLSRAQRAAGSSCKVHVAALNLTLRLGVQLLDGGFEPAQQAFLSFTHADSRNEFMASLLALLQFNRLVVPKFAKPPPEADDAEDDGSTVFERTSQSTIVVSDQEDSSAQMDLGADAEAVQSWQQLHLAMQLIQQLCEGHFTAWQDELRTQENQSTQYDIISSLTETLAGMMCDAGPLWYALVYWSAWYPPAGLALVVKSLLQLLATLTEVVQGPNFGNQQSLSASRLLSAVSWTMDAVNTCFGHAKFPMQPAEEEKDFGHWHSLLVQYASQDANASAVLGKGWLGSSWVQNEGCKTMPHQLDSTPQSGVWGTYAGTVARQLFIDADDDSEAHFLFEARHSILLRVQSSCCALLSALLEGPLAHGHSHQAIANSDIISWLPVTLAHQLSLCSASVSQTASSLAEQRERLSGGAWDGPAAYVDVCTRWHALLVKLALHHGVGPDMDVRPALQRAANLLSAGPTAAPVSRSTQSTHGVHEPAFVQGRLGSQLEGLARVYPGTTAAVLALLCTVPVQALRQLCGQRVGHVEIMREGRLEPFVFEIPDVIQSFRHDADYHKAREAFLQDVNRDNAFTRVEGLFNATPQLMFELVPQTGLKASILARFNAQIAQVSFVLALCLNVMLLTGSSLDSDSSDVVDDVLFWIAVAAAAFSGLRFMGYILRKVESWSAIGASPKSGRPPACHPAAAAHAARDPVAIFNALHLAATVAAVIVRSDLLLCVQLVDFITHSALLRSTLSALASYAGSLAATASLWAILLYVFAAIGHASFAEDFPEGRCDSLTTCVWFTLNFGLRAGGGVGDFLAGGEEGEDSGTLRSWYDVVFFILLTVVMSSIVTGIIIDSFSAARDHRAEVQDNQSSECFVCGLERSKFDREGRGFEFHCHRQHNMWQYVYAMAYLQLKEPTEYTGAESFVAGCLETEELSFFPVAHSTLDYTPRLVVDVSQTN